jgi:hypothetical protein
VPAGDDCHRWVMSRTTQISDIPLGLWHAARPGRLSCLRPGEMMPVSDVPLDPGGSRAQIRAHRQRRRRSSQARLPGHVPVEPSERRPDHWPLVPASGHDFAADRLSGTAQPLAHYCRLKVPRPAAQEMNTVDADTYLGMVAQVDQGIFGAGTSAAPARALACLADRCLSVSAHCGSHLLGHLRCQGSDVRPELSF